MIVVERIAELRSLCDDACGAGRTVGLVPTMGYFHEGHRSLMRAARAATDLVVVTLFVNPTQFGPNEDLAAYPHDLVGDAAVAEAEGVDVLFVPPVEEMYPHGTPLTVVHVARLTEDLCGAARPTHFDGVTTVVTKLFSIVGASIAFFGRKDYQQLAVIRQMTADLDLPVDVRGCPLVREEDGVAMSSRNAYLTPEERSAARVLSESLRSAADAVVAGERRSSAIEAEIRRQVGTEPLVALEYAEARDARTLEPRETLSGEVVVAVAAKVGRARLIDNVVLGMDGADVVVDLGARVGVSVTPARFRNLSPMADLLVLGSGIAGLSAAIHAARRGRTVVVLTKGELALSATRYAQGGVAAALEAPDSAELHLSDTLAAGAGLCDSDAVRVLVTEGPGRVRDLMALGAVFDRTGDGATAALALAREGGHSVSRVVHAGGDATGAEIERALVAAVHALDLVDVRERCFAVDLIVEDGRCVGVHALDPTGAPMEIRAHDTIVATGGAGQLFEVTTNPVVSTGDGIALALRAGAVVADIEFMQFHPTALHHPSMPRPLLSEALRGEGAVLRDEHGMAFMADEHPLADLAPRDVVSRAIARRLVDRGIDHLWLDATSIDDFPDRFPTIWGSAQSVDLDPRADWLPVAPAAHYLCGGIATDLDGASTVPGLWSCGEAACSGVHGANRLASNSLLDGLVFAPRAVDAIVAKKDGPESTGVLRALSVSDGTPVALPSTNRSRAAAATGTITLAELQRVMTAGAGVLRDEDSLRGVLDRLPTTVAADGPDSYELRNLLVVGWALTTAALARQESRGTHTRLDFPERSNALLGRFFQQDDAVAFHPLPLDVRQPSA